MDTHAFPEGVKVQIFCLTLVGEARLWYESLLDWNGLQTQFRRQYSKIGTAENNYFIYDDNFILMKTQKH